MSSPNGKPLSERLSDHKSSRADSPRRRRSYSRERGERRREKREHDDRKRSSHSRERHKSERGDRRSRSHDRSHHRDKDRDRERRRERDERDGRHREREDRERRERRRKREEEPDSIDANRHKRKRDEKDFDITTAGAPSVNDDNVSVSRSDRRDRSHDSERRQSDRHPRRSREDQEEIPPRRRDDRELRRDSDKGYERKIDRDRRVPSREIDDEPERILTPPRPIPVPSPPIIRRPSPQYEPPPDSGDEPNMEDEDSEARSVFVSQLAARLTARDLGYFFEDKLGDGTVKDSRIVTDRLSRRSKGIGYVEFRSIELVPKAIALSGTIVMGLPIMVQLTESERNKLHPGDGSINLPPGVSASSHGSMQIYVGSLHFNLTESDIKQVFEPFGELDFVDLHRDPMTGRSKGFCFIQYKRPEDARMALEQMEGFELAGRTLRVKTVHEKGTARLQQQDSLDEAGGGNLNAASRQALMQKLARIEPPPTRSPDIVRPNIPQQQASRCVLLKNMFTPEEETERDWDKDLAEDVKGECEQQYGKVERIKVEKETQGEIYVKFDSVGTAEKAFKGLNGRWFGGKEVSAHFISDAIMQAH
ncbi:splicing factor, CC1-like protein [Ramaria rubella]|nr:splicing factor, CC1-like protein [Ramaria rubella]